MSLVGRLEALHLPFSSAGEPVRILGPLVQIPARSVPNIGKEVALRDAVAAQAICDEMAWLVLKPVQQAPEETL
jgi:hypothetical protein